MKTGWPPGLLQDDDRKLSRWFAGKPDARYQLRKSMKEDIPKMAREAGAERNSDFPDWSFEDDQLERFAAIVADRCAEIAYEAEPWHSADLIREAFGVKR